MNYYNLSFLLSRMSVGGSHIKSNLTGGQSVNNLNNILTKAITIVGLIVIVFAVIKMVLALADENAKSRSDSAIMLGVGIFFSAAAQVMKSIGISSISNATSVITVGRNILAVIGNFLTYSGGALAAIAVFSLIMAVMHENPDQQAKASNLLMVSVGLISARALTNAIAAYMNSHTSSPDPSAVFKIAVNFIAQVVTYGGGAIAALAVFKFVMSVRTEDSRERDGAIKMFLVAIGFLSFSAIIYNLFGL